MGDNQTENRHGLSLVLMCKVILWFLPEIISLIANIADVFMEYSVRLYIVKAECENLYPFRTDCLNIDRDSPEYEKIQESLTSIFMWNRVLQDVPVFLILPIFGSYADISGRKLPIAISAIASTFSALVYLISTYNPSKYLNLVLLGSALRGVSCRGNVVIVVVSSMVADVTTGENRTWRLSTLLATKYVGNIFGLLFQAFLLENDMFSTVFLLNVISYCLIALIALALVSANTPSDDQNETSKNIASAVKDEYTGLFKVVTEKPKNSSRLAMWIVFIVIALDRACKSGMSDVIILMVNFRLPYFTDSDFSWFFMGEAFAAVFISTVVTYVLSKYVTDITFLILGSVFGAIRNLAMSLSYSVLMLYTAIIVGSPISFLVSASRSQLSQMVDVTNYGKLFAFIGILDTIANIFGSLLFLGIYQHLSKYFSGIVFAVCAILYFLMIILLAFYQRIIKRNKEEEQAITG